MASPLIKQWVGDILKPFVWLAQTSTALRRMWAHTHLAEKIQYPLDPSVVVLNCPEVHGTGQIQLGKNLFLYRELYFETQGAGKIILEDEVVLSRGVHVVAFSDIHIGVGVMIGEYSSIRDANHQYKNKTSLRYAGYIGASITIGKHVWIGRGSTVLAGVTIGDHAVIGANAVVNKDIPPYTLAVGVPARPIKRFDD